MYRRTASMLLSTLITIASVGPATGQSPSDRVSSSSYAEVLVLGTWHMASITEGPDDILERERQKQVRDVIDALARFKPTKVALEAAFYRNDDMNRLYKAYLNGEHELTRNERQQLGFRLARKLGHESVHSIDADGDFPMLTLQDYVHANGLSERFSAMQAEFRAWLSEWESFRASHTLLEALVRMNSDTYAAARMEHDYALAHFGEPWNWAGPDLLSDWFRRNARIYGNVVALVESPDERILVIIGAGHLAWLRHSFQADPHIRLRKLEDFARRPR